MNITNKNNNNNNNINNNNAMNSYGYQQQLQHMNWRNIDNSKHQYNQNQNSINSNNNNYTVGYVSGNINTKIANTIPNNNDNNNYNNNNITKQCYNFTKINQHNKSNNIIHNTNYNYKNTQITNNNNNNINKQTYMYTNTNTSTNYNDMSRYSNNHHNNSHINNAKKQRYLMTTKITNNSYDNIDYNIAQHNNIYDNNNSYYEQQNHMNNNSTSNSNINGKQCVGMLQKILNKRIITIYMNVFNTISSNKQNNNKGDNKNNKSNNKNINIHKTNNNKQIQMQMFINHCATLIQSKFKSYQQYKYYNIFKPVYRRFKQLMHAVVQGWKTRRVINTKIIKKKIQKLKQISNNHSMSANNNKNNNNNNNFSVQNNNKQRQIRILRRQIVDQIYRIINKGKWVQYVDKNNKNNNKNQNKLKITRILLKSSSSISNKGNKDKMAQKIVQKQIINHEKQMQAIQKQRQIEIPIKATGFYNIPQQIDNNLQNQSSKNNKKKLKQSQSLSKQKKKYNKKYQKNKSNIQQKQIKKCDDKIKVNQVNTIQQAIIQNKYQIPTKQNKDKKQHDNSALTINLTTEQINFEQNMHTSIPNRTIKLNNTLNSINKISSQLGCVQEKMNLGSTQKINLNALESINVGRDTNNFQNNIKKVKKGIKVSLASSSKPIQNTTEYTHHNKNTMQGHQNNIQKLNLQQNKQFVNKSDVSQINQQNKLNGQLQQILTVYNTRYSSKRKQIDEKYKNMLTQRKYVS